jgi:formylglycine-generating enzyme required for sulfatase activity
MKKTGLLSTLIILTASAMLATGCSTAKDAGASLLALLGGGRDVPSYSQEVGPEGGTVTDPRGAVIIIPAGALSETTTITVKTYANKNDVRNRFGIPVFSAGVELLPDGLTFAKPVTVTLPTGTAMTPGEKRSIVQYHGTKYSFRETDLQATVEAGGQTMSFRTTHFCVLLTSPILPLMADTFILMLETLNMDTALAFDAFIQWFTYNTNWMGTEIEDLEKDEIWTVKGIYFDVLWSKKTPTGPVKEGEMTRCQGVCDVPERTPLNVNIYSDDYDYMSSDGETQYIYSVKVNVHFKVTDEPQNDNLSVSIIDPLSDESINGTRSIMTATMLKDDDAPVTKMEYFLDASLVHTDTEAPFTFAWDTTTATNGDHELTVKAFDSELNEATSEPVTVTVDNNSKPVSVEFADTDPLQNKLGGDIVIVKAPNEGSIVNYVLCWGTAIGVRLPGYDAIATLPPIGSDITYTIDEGTDLPEGAESIVVYIDSGAEIRNSNVNCALDDYINDALSAVTKRDMVTVPAGTYTQQSNYNTDEGDVDVADDGEVFSYTNIAFRIGKHEVTYELWYTVYQWAIAHDYYFSNAGREGSSGAVGGAPGTDKFMPVTTINWRDSIVWCNAYSELAGLRPVYYSDSGFTAPIRDSRDGDYGADMDATPGSFDDPYIDPGADGYRLPTESEWQYAASYVDGSSWTPWNYASGAAADYLNKAACDAVAVYGEYWDGDSWEPTGISGTAAVGSKQPNALGIYDMSGNIEESCFDWHPLYIGIGRIGRGDNWNQNSTGLSVGYVDADYPYIEYSFLGFRVARN